MTTPASVSWWKKCIGHHWIGMGSCQNIQNFDSILPTRKWNGFGNCSLMALDLLRCVGQSFCRESTFQTGVMMLLMLVTSNIRTNSQSRLNTKPTQLPNMPAPARKQIDRAKLLDDWISYLTTVGEEKICASCWAGQLEKYLDRCFRGKCFVLLPSKRFGHFDSYLSLLWVGYL